MAFKKYGEVDSYEEINTMAANQKAQGDLEAIKEIAKENGIDEMDAEDYINGDIDTLCTLTSAAIGKLSAEKEELELPGLMSDWEMWIEKECLESPDFAKAVRRKGKSLAGAIAALMTWSADNSVDVPKEIAKHFKGNARGARFGVPGMTTVARLVREYYLGGDAK